MYYNLLRKWHKNPNAKYSIFISLIKIQTFVKTSTCFTGTSSANVPLTQCILWRLYSNFRSFCQKYWYNCYMLWWPRIVRMLLVQNLRFVIFYQLSNLLAINVIVINLLNPKGDLANCFEICGEYYFNFPLLQRRGEWWMEAK